MSTSSEIAKLDFDSNAVAQFCSSRNTVALTSELEDWTKISG